MIACITAKSDCSARPVAIVVRLGTNVIDSIKKYIVLIAFTLRWICCSILTFSANKARTGRSDIRVVKLTPIAYASSETWPPYCPH
jgi:hypothetical protein